LVFTLFVAPIWILVVVGLSVAVIFALTAVPEELGKA
jgi:hypothetical protein